MKLGSGFVFKFSDNRRNSERKLYWKTAQVSVSILYINTCWVRITGKQKSGQVRLVTISVTVLDKKLSSIREMSARCHTRGVPGIPLLHIYQIFCSGFLLITHAWCVLVLS